MNEKRSLCTDCNKIQDIEKVYCEIHQNCEDYCFECAECGSLNVECQI